MKNLLCQLSILFIMTTSITSCGNNETTNTATNSDSTAMTQSGENIAAQDWGETDGKKVSLYTLTNKNGVEVKISNYGGTITSWITPDKNGNKSQIVLGFDSLSGYLQKPAVPFFGATIGRYGNRIGKAQFKIDTATYKLAANNGANSLHGGNQGFDKVVWDATQSGDNK